MFTEKDLVAGETVLVWKESDVKVLYLGSAGLVNFISEDDDFKKAGDCNFTIEDLNKLFTIEQPKTNAVPLEKKVYDFVPVRVRDYEACNWEDKELILVSPDALYPYRVYDSLGRTTGFKQCEFLNEQ